MNEIREEFEKWYNTRNIGIDNPLYDSGKEALFRAYSVRDDEELKAENKKLTNLYEKLKDWHAKALNMQAKMAEDLEPYLNKIDDLEAENKKLKDNITALKIVCNSRGKELVSYGKDDITFYAIEWAETIKDGE